MRFITSRGIISTLASFSAFYTDCEIISCLNEFLHTCVPFTFVLSVLAVRRDSFARSSFNYCSEHLCKVFVVMAVRESWECQRPLIGKEVNEKVMTVTGWENQKRSSDCRVSLELYGWLIFSMYWTSPPAAGNGTVETCWRFYRLRILLPIACCVVRRDMGISGLGTE